MHSLVSHGWSALLAILVTSGLPTPLTGSRSVVQVAEAAPLPAANAKTSEKTAPPRVEADHVELDALGSLSLGDCNRGRLVNGVQPPEGRLFELVSPNFSFGTEETVSALVRAVELVHEEHPGTQPLHVGHLSAPSGGKLSPHLSHQSGRDVDLGFYYKAKRAWYRRATALTLDVERTWTLVSALITETDVEMILVDRSIHPLLRAEAKRRGASEAWLNSLFRGTGSLPPIIRHARGHATHLHVRFFSPIAEKNAARAYPILVERKIIEPLTTFTYYQAKKGDTLGRIADRFGVSVRQIQTANGLRGTLIQARKVYKIPREAGLPPVKPREVPPRRLPEASAEARKGQENAG